MRFNGNGLILPGYGNRGIIKRLNAPENTMWKENWNGSMENDCDLNSITGAGEAKEMPNPLT